MIQEAINKLRKAPINPYTSTAIVYLEKWQKVAEAETEDDIRAILRTFGTPEPLRSERAKEWSGHPEKVERHAIEIITFLFPEIKGYLNELE